MQAEREQLHAPHVEGKHQMQEFQAKEVML